MIKAVIFDMDGVILDSMPMHERIWKEIFEKRKIKFTLKEFEKYNGTSTKEIAQEIIERYNLNEKADDIINEKHNMEIKVWETSLFLFPETIPTLKNLRKQGYKLALATSALKHMVDYVKQKFGIDKYFDVLVCSSDVKKTKPAPDIFLLAANKLDESPSSCVVVEDAINGIDAAKSAGMTAVAITNTFRKNAFRNADFIISNLLELNITKLEKVKIECVE